jgi:hypothetical protein
MTHYLSQTGCSSSELDLAREHLRKRQEDLARERRALSEKPAPMRNSPQVMKECIKDVLAALSWVWDAQERERETDTVTYYAGIHAFEKDWVSKLRDGGRGLMLITPVKGEMHPGNEITGALKGRIVG